MPAESWSLLVIAVVLAAVVYFAIHLHGRLRHITSTLGRLESHTSAQALESQQLDQLVDLLQQKASHISGKYPELSVSPIVKVLSALVTAHREVLPQLEGGDPDVINVQVPV